jgi:peptidoglycan pentaglycine glycine transferase (the first glycine)
MSDLYVVKIKIKNLIETYENILRSIQDEIDGLDASKYKNKNKLENKKKDLTKKLEKQQKELDIIKKIKDEELILSSIMTAKYNDKVWTIHGGNHNLLRELNANYLLYYTIIKDAKEEGYKKIDFFGTTGEPDKNNSVYGIHLFKKRLGGEYTEFIGEFDLVLNPILYFMYTKVYPKVRKYLKRR